MADPAAALKAEGVEIPAGYTVRVLENTDKVVNYVLPPNPNAELSDSELEAVAGGKMSDTGTYIPGTGSEETPGTQKWFDDLRKGNVHP